MLGKFAFMVIVAALLGMATPGYANGGDQEVTNTNDSGPGSFRQAVLDVGPGNLITFKLPGSPPHTILLTSGAVSLDSTMSIVGPGALDLIIDASYTSQIFSAANNGQTLHIEGLTLARGEVTGSVDGAALSNFGAAVTFAACIIRDCSSERDGGAIWQTSIGTPSVTLRDTTVMNCLAGLNGGAAAADGGTIHVVRPTTKPR